MGDERDERRRGRRRGSLPGAFALLRIAEAGARSERIHPLTGDTCTIGRALDNDLVLAEASVSRRHARLVRDGDRWVIEDLGAGNGTRVNGRPVRRARLSDGDVILLGTVRLDFEDPAEAAVRRARRRLLLGVAAAALAGGILGAWLLGRAGGEPAPDPQVAEAARILLGSARSRDTAEAARALERARSALGRRH